MDHTDSSPRSQDPTPQSPIDRVRTTIEASIDAGLSSPSPPPPLSATASKTLPLPASSSLLGEEDRPFAKPIRSFTNPNLDAVTKEEPAVLTPAVTVGRTEEEGEVEQEVVMEDQPAIAELPATPLASPDLQSHKSNKESPRTKEIKPEDSSVLYNLPLTPSAEAYEVAKQNSGRDGYFEPVFPGEDPAKNVPPVVEGGRS